jgi:hypothetical protein
MIRRTFGVTTLALGVTLAGGTVNADPDMTRPAVFLTLPTTHGFVDATQALVESQDLVRDAIGTAGDVRLVQHREDADVVLTVLARGRGDVQLTAALNALDESVIASPVPLTTNERYIEATLTVGSCIDEAAAELAKPRSCYKRVFVGLGLSDRDPRRSGKRPAANSWEACAEALVRDVRAWLNENAARVRALR